MKFTGIGFLDGVAKGLKMDWKRELRISKQASGYSPTLVPAYIGIRSSRRPQEMSPSRSRLRCTY